MTAPPLERVEAREVSKLYGRQRALWRVSLTLTPGRTVALLGPNGSGKTTLLDLFSTLSRPTSGEMLFGSLPPERSRDARGRIGLLSHAPLTYGDLTGLENVRFYAELHRIEQPEACSARLLGELGLAEAMGRPARTYSRGMLQRLGLARALIGRPSLVLLDEPFTGLDRASTERVVERVRALVAEGAMVLMISHELGTAAELADQVVILFRGQVAAQHHGRTSEPELRRLYAQHAEARAPDAATAAGATS